MRVCRTADDRDAVAELVAQPVELAPLVLVAESGGAREQVVLDGDGRSPGRAWRRTSRSRAYSQRAAAARSDAL